MENQPKLGACVLGTKGVGFSGKGRDFPWNSDHGFEEKRAGEFFGQGNC
jgi:hypothetical protein